MRAPPIPNPYKPPSPSSESTIYHPSCPTETPGLHSSFPTCLIPWVTKMWTLLCARGVTSRIGTGHFGGGWRKVPAREARRRRALRSLLRRGLPRGIITPGRTMIRRGAMCCHRPASLRLKQRISARQRRMERGGTPPQVQKTC